MIKEGGLEKVDETDGSLTYKKRLPE